jgi:hypothetical protein
VKSEQSATVAETLNKSQEIILWLVWLLTQTLGFTSAALPGVTERQMPLSSVTEEGFELITHAPHGWVRGITTGKWLGTDATLLIKELGKPRESKKR